MPVSKKQLAANRANAKKSTGPKTDNGKRTSARNATTHGLYARQFVVEPQHQEAFDDLHTMLRAEILPLGALETDAFQQLLHAAWQLRRSDSLEAQLHDPLGSADSQIQHLERLARLRATFERSYQRAYRRLRELQNIRAGELSLSNPAALIHNATTPIANPPKPEKPPEFPLQKRSHYEPPTFIFQWVKERSLEGDVPRLPFRALLRIWHQMLEQKAEATGGENSAK